jgi:hypothetical protein
VVVYWPGETFCSDQDARKVHHPLAAPYTTPQARAALAAPTDQTALLEEVLRLCGDRQNAAAYRKALREHPEHRIRMVLAETRQATMEHRIGKTRGAFFFETLRRLATCHTPPTS